MEKHHDSSVGPSLDFETLEGSNDPIGPDCPLW